MAGFGDNTTVFQRAATFGTGGKIEYGEFTSGTGSKSVSIPTRLSKVVMGMAIEDGTDGVQGTPTNQDVTGSTIDFTMSDATFGSLHYIAMGW